MSTLSHPGDALTRGARLTYVLVLGALVGLGPFTVDLYLPAFPAVRAELLATEAAVQITLTATMIGFAVGQLLLGPWSDVVGRRLPLLLATTVHIAASVGVALAPDILTVTVLRVVQGVGAAGGSVVAMAMVRDLFGGSSLVRMLSRLALVSGLAPIVAPVVGSQLLRVLDWRGLFIALAAYSLLVLVLVAVFIVETLPAERRRARRHSSAADRYRALFGDRVFLGIVAVSGAMFSGLIAYVSSSSFVLQEVYGLDPQAYGVVFAVNSVGLAIGAQTAARVVRRVGPQWLLAVTLPTMALAGLGIVVAVGVGLGLPAVLVGTFVFLVGAGFSFPCLQVIALAPHGEEAGTAAAMLGLANFGTAGIVSPLVGLLGTETAIPMGAVMAATLGVATLVLWLVVRPRSVPALDAEAPAPAAH